MLTFGPSHCLNCGVLLAENQSYCGQCGQKTRPLRLNLRDITTDLLHALLHVDRSVASLIRQLAVRPGLVAREYVEGKRKRYFGPFAFLVIAVGLASALVAISGFTAVSNSAGTTDPVLQFLQHHVNLIYLVQVPLLGAFCAALFRKDRRFYAEHLVLVSYATGMRSVLLMSVAVPFWWLFRPSALWLMYAYLCLWLAYFGFAASQFYAGNRWIVGLKGALAATLAQIATSWLIGVAVYGYSRLAGSG